MISDGRLRQLIDWIRRHERKALREQDVEEVDFADVAALLEELRAVRKDYGDRYSNDPNEVERRPDWGEP